MRPVAADSEGEEFSFFAEDDADVLEVANQIGGIGERRESVPKVDADFFNKFEDDFDESDMRPQA